MPETSCIFSQAAHHIATYKQGCTEEYASLMR